MTNDGAVPPVLLCLIETLVLPMYHKRPLRYCGMNLHQYKMKSPQKNMVFQILYLFGNNAPVAATQKKKKKRAFTRTEADTRLWNENIYDLWQADNKCTEEVFLMLEISDTLFSLMAADAYSTICFRQLLQQCPALNMKRTSEHPALTYWILSNNFTCLEYLIWFVF